MPIVLVAIHEKRPKDTDKDGFQLRYIAEVHGTAIEGAQITIEMLDEALEQKRRDSGVYQCKYQEVRDALQVIMDAAPKPWTSNIFVRIGAGLLAFALTMVMGAAVAAGTLFWLVVCAVKKQSGMLTMAETAVMWSILDWRPIIHPLIRIALGKR